MEINLYSRNFQFLKRLLAITLLALYLFNLAGYPLLFRYLGKAATSELETKIDHQNFREADLVEIKVKLNLPYFTTTAEYEKLVGEINLDGRTYNYVKRKVSQDTLYLLCLPNDHKDRLRSSETGYGNVANDFDNKGSNEKASKKIPAYNQFHQSPAEYVLTQLASAAESYSCFVLDITAQYCPPDNGRPPRMSAEI